MSSFQEEKKEENKKVLIEELDTDSYKDFKSKLKNRIKRKIQITIII